MAGRKSRMVLNREALAAVDAGLADGTFDSARAILRVSEARAPDRPPIGEGLVMRGAAVVWVGRKRVHQVRTDGLEQNVNKPRGSARLLAGNIYGVVGWGFPAMFLELGTVYAHARPFLTPAVAEVLGEIQIILSEAMQRRLRGERSPMTPIIRERIAAARAARAAG